MTASSSLAPFASKRLATDAKKVLERAGYFVQDRTRYMNAYKHNNLLAILWIDETAFVDNAEVEKLLEVAR